MMKKHGRIVVALTLGCSIVCTAAGAGQVSFAAQSGVAEYVVNSRVFDVKIAPKNAESARANMADLYWADQSGHWRLEGPCKITQERGQPIFTRRVTAPQDGRYLFVSRAGTDNVQIRPPGSSEPADSAVIVDTTPPSIQLYAPQGGTSARIGQQVTIQWHAQDENFPNNPIGIDWSHDGKVWTTLVQGIPNTGRFDWTVEDYGLKEMYLRVTATDRAGNRNSAATMLPLKINKFRSDSEMLDNSLSTSRDAEMAYIIAGNLVRRGEPKDSLRFYHAAVEEDNHFTEAWNDLALVYGRLGAFDEGEEAINEALRIEPENPALLITLGEIHYLKALQLYFNHGTAAEMSQGEAAAQAAEKAFLDAIAAAENGMGRVPDCAAAYFRLGEMRLKFHHDPVGTRQYWNEVLQLHSPTPDLDAVAHDYYLDDTARESSIAVLQRQTEAKSKLRDWQRWTKAHLDQLDYLEGKTPVIIERDNYVDPYDLQSNSLNSQYNNYGQVPESQYSNGLRSADALYSADGYGIGEQSHPANNPVVRDHFLEPAAGAQGEFLTKGYGSLPPEVRIQDPIPMGAPVWVSCSQAPLMVGKVTYQPNVASPMGGCEEFIDPNAWGAQPPPSDLNQAGKSPVATKYSTQYNTNSSKNTAESYSPQMYRRKR